MKNKQRFDLSHDGTFEVKKDIPDSKAENREFFYFLMGTVGEIGFAVALPIITGALLGKFLDTKFGWYPQATLSGLVGGVFISFVGLIGTVQTVIKRSDEMKRKTNVKSKL